MASLALASIPDLEARMGQNVDTARAQAAIDDASSLIHLATNNVWIVDGALVAGIPGVALTVCCAAARRILDNPDLVTAEQIGHANFTYADSSNEAFLKKAELTAVRKAAGISLIGTITLESPYPTRYELTDLYVSVEGTDEMLPFGPFPTEFVDTP